eukprot:gene13140-8874_t
MWETGDNRIDKTVFNPKDEYTGMINSKRHNEQFAVSEKVKMDKLRPQIYELQEKMDNLQNVEKSEEYQDLDKKQNELETQLNEIKFQLSLNNYDPVKQKDAEWKIQQQLDEIRFPDEKSSPSKKKGKKTPTKGKQTPVIIKKPQTEKELIKKLADVQREIEKNRPLTEEEENIQKHIDELKKKKEKITKKANKMKEQILEQHKDAMNKYKTHQQKSKKYQDDVTFWDDAIERHKKTHLKGKIEEKIAKTDPVTSLLDGIKMGSKAQLYVGPAINDLNIDFETTRKSMQDKYNDFMGSYGL